jgi:arginine repressor
MKPMKTTILYKLVQGNYTFWVNEVAMENVFTVIKINNHMVMIHVKVGKTHNWWCSFWWGGWNEHYHKGAQE